MGDSRTMAAVEDTFGPLERADLPGRIARILTDKIVSGAMKPGEHLPEAAVARALGVSRAPVREAARLLESSGLLVAHVNRGFFVRTITAEDLDDLFELRCAVECAAAERLSRHLDEATLSALGASLQTMEQLSQKGEAVAMIEEDMAFHRIVVAASGNRRFLSLFDQIAGEMRFGVAVIGRLYDDPCEIAATHRPLLEAIAKGTGVREAFVYHIETARHHVVALYRAIEET